MSICTLLQGLTKRTNAKIKTCTEITGIRTAQQKEVVKILPLLKAPALDYIVLRMTPTKVKCTCRPTSYEVALRLQVCYYQCLRVFLQNFLRKCLHKPSISYDQQTVQEIAAHDHYLIKTNFKMNFSLSEQTAINEKYFVCAFS
jgi:hypothetical protein